VRAHRRRKAHKGNNKFFSKRCRNASKRRPEATVTEPISVRVDLEVPAAYVKYRKTASVDTRDIVEGGAVAYDLDDTGSIVGLEVLWFDDSAHVDAAKAFAAQHDLAFPQDLRGNLIAA